MQVGEISHPPDPSEGEGQYVMRWFSSEILSFFERALSNPCLLSADFVKEDNHLPTKYFLKDINTNN